MQLQLYTAILFAVTIAFCVIGGVLLIRQSHVSYSPKERLKEYYLYKKRLETVEARVRRLEVVVYKNEEATCIKTENVEESTKDN